MKALTEPTLSLQNGALGRRFLGVISRLFCSKIRQPDNEEDNRFLFYKDFFDFLISLSKPKNNEMALKPLQPSRRTDRPARVHSSHNTANRPPGLACATTIWRANAATHSLRCAANASVSRPLRVAALTTAKWPWAGGSARAGGKRAPATGRACTATTGHLACSNTVSTDCSSGAQTLAG